MTLSRAFPLVLALTAPPLWPAAAQFWTSPLAQCPQLVADRDETQKHGKAPLAAGKKKLPPDELCTLFKAFLGAESKMIKGLEDNSATCGVPAEVLKQVKTSHDRAAQMGKQVCELAPQGRFAPPPHCSETLQPIPCVD